MVYEWHIDKQLKRDTAPKKQSAKTDLLILVNHFQTQQQVRIPNASLLCISVLGVWW